MKTKILKLLRSDASYISGQELCQQLHVSRTAVWKVMNQLKEEGYVIEAVQNKGYCLVQEPDLLTKSALQSRMNTKWAAQSVICVAETGSTNQELKKLAEEGAVHGTLFVANTQNAGRGRRGREWDSKQGDHITMSLLLRPDFAPDIASQLTLVMAASVVKAIEALTGLCCQIKWPNDVLIENRKVSGILTEMSAEMGYIHYVVIGVGINVNYNVVPKDLVDIATSLQLESGKSIERATLIAKVMECFEHLYEQFCHTGNLSNVQEWYNEHLINKDAVVKVLQPNNEFEAIARGINEMGELVVERENRLEKIYAGEVSIRGTKGYV